MAQSGIADGLSGETMEARYDVGKRIRRARQLVKLTLQDVSARSGISVSALSKIETGRVAVKFATLQKLCESLDLSLTQLQSGVDERTVPGARVVSRHENAIHHDVGVYDYAIHCSELIRKGMFPTVITVKARNLEEFEEWNRHAGEEFLYVIKGQIELQFESYGPTLLKAGDCAYYDSGLGHAFIRRGREEALVLSVSLDDRPGHELAQQAVSGGRVPSPAKPARRLVVGKPPAVVS